MAAGRLLNKTAHRRRFSPWRSPNPRGTPLQYEIGAEGSLGHQASARLDAPQRGRSSNAGGRVTDLTPPHLHSSAAAQPCRLSALQLPHHPPRS